MWRELSQAEKDVYKRQAAEIKRQFDLDHPDYVYNPRSSAEIKRRKPEKKVAAGRVSKVAAGRGSKKVATGKVSKK